MHIKNCGSLMEPEYVIYTVPYEELTYIVPYEELTYIVPKDV